MAIGIMFMQIDLHCDNCDFFWNSQFKFVSHVWSEQQICATSHELGDEYQIAAD